MVVQEVDLVDIEAKDYLLGITLLTGRTVHYLVIWGVNAKISRSVVMGCHKGMTGEVFRWINVFRRQIFGSKKSVI